MTFILSVKVTPKAKQNKIVGWENGWLKVQIHALPEKGEANKELLTFLAKVLKIPKTSLYVVSGATSRLKKVCVENLAEEEVLDKVIAWKEV